MIAPEGLSRQNLIDAIKAQSLRGVQDALAAGARPNAYVQGVSMLGLHEDAVWPATKMHETNWLAILDVLLKHGANPDLPADHGVPLLHSLSQSPVLPAIRTLLDAGANPNLLADGQTALDWESGDASYTETCCLPEEYKGRVLPNYPLPKEDEWDTGNVNCARWLMSVHQRAYRMLRQAGALFSWELREVPVKEELCLYPDRLGGLYTSHGRPDAAFLARIGNDLLGRIRRWAADYVDPDVFGYDARETQQFDYAACLQEAFSIGKAIAPFLCEDVSLKTYLPTRESIAAGCTLGDAYKWNRVEEKWEKTSSWQRAS